MTAKDAAAWIRVPGPRPLRARFYRALARTVLARGAGAEVVFESTLDEPGPRTLVRPGSLADPLFAEPAFSAIPIARGEVPPPLRPTPGSPGKVLGIVTPRGAAEALTSTSIRDPPRVRKLVGPEGWLATQTLWAWGPRGRIWAARRAWLAAPTTDELSRRLPGVGQALAEGWWVATGAPSTARALGFGAARDWLRGGARSLPREAWAPVVLDRLERTAEPAWAAEEPFEPARDGHGIVLGSSGGGKTWLLAERAACSIRRGEPVFSIDLHGDLAPAIVARLDPDQRRSVVCVDASDRPVPGISALDRSAPPERAAAHLVAALKRLSADGSELHWGFRLERILESFVRLVQESDGTLVDVYAMLTDRERREAARLSTARPDLARFLEELGPIVGRAPDFLWAATARLSKIVLVPALADLLAPTDGGLPVEELLASGRSVLLRVPFALLGPEAAAFAGSIALARVYLSLAARGGMGSGSRPVLVVLDEVQGLSPRLVAEMLGESRKFGLRLLLATQYPDRLAPELRPAAAGVVRDIVAFQIPPPSAGLVGGWLGLSPPDAARWLVDLAPGYGIAREPGSVEPRLLAPADPPSGSERDAWERAVVATRVEFPPPPPRDASGSAGDRATERLLLAVLAAEERGSPLPAERLVEAALELPGEPADLAELSDTAGRLGRLGLLEVAGEETHLSPAGERRLGLGAPTGATRESAEHRALLTAAFRILARKGYLLEIVRQGRWDTTLPDAVLRQLPDRTRSSSPVALSAAIDLARHGWAWRFFSGRDVHVEAEVSGALRPARIRHGLRKAVPRNAFVLFLVADARRAARVRATLRAEGVGPDRAQVWTLRAAAAARGPPLPETVGRPSLATAARS